MATVTPSHAPPVAPLLAQIALLIREGVSGWLRPDPYATPYWENWDAKGITATGIPVRTGCPAGHYLLTEGTRMYLDDQRERITPPYIHIAQASDATPRGSRLPAVMWDVPIVVEIAWQADTEDDVRLILGMLLGLLCLDFPAQPVGPRLTSSQVLVYGRDTITQVHPERLRSADGYSAARLTFHVLCSTLA